MAVSYEFSIGSVRARENALFTKTDMEQLLGCQTTAQLCRTLSDKGYGAAADFDEMVERHDAAVWKYLKSVAPDFSIFTPFLIQNDVHNFKIVLKGTMSARDYYTALLLEPCTVAHRDMIYAVEHRSMSGLPAWLQQPAAAAYDLLARTGDARASDAVLDKALMQEMLRESEQLRSAFLREYIRTLVFYANIKTALRGARAGADKHYFKAAMPRMEGFDRDKTAQAAAKGHDALTGLLAKKSDYGCSKAMERYKESPSAFEKFVDDRLMTLARESCKRASEGAEPLLGYYLGEEAQKKTLHIIYSGIKTGAGADAVRERLREIYG